MDNIVIFPGKARLDQYEGYNVNLGHLKACLVRIALTSSKEAFKEECSSAIKESVKNLKSLSVETTDTGVRINILTNPANGEFTYSFELKNMFFKK